MKKLTINTAMCDLRNVTEAQLAAYDAITVNAATVLTCPAAQTLLSRLPVQVNAASVCSLEGDVELVQANGSYTIGGTPSGGRKVLLLNGALTIAPDGGAALAQYVKLAVNGTVLCPESLAEGLGAMQLNGSRYIYPDDARVMGSPSLDRFFALRAGAGRYFAPVLAATDLKLDLKVLGEKGVTFLAGRVVAAESLVEDLLPLVPEDAELIPVPDGTVYVRDRLLLEDGMEAMYGGKLYVDGELFCHGDHVKDLFWLEYLAVAGQVHVSEDRKADLLARLDRCGGVQVMPQRQETELSDQKYVVVDRGLLALSPAGAALSDCETVELAEDLPPAEILEKLRFTDCRRVYCTAEQRGAALLRAEDTDYVGPPEEDPTLGLDWEETVINAAEYAF